MIYLCLWHYDFLIIHDFPSNSNILQRVHHKTYFFLYFTAVISGVIAEITYKGTDFSYGLSERKMSEV